MHDYYDHKIAKASKQRRYNEKKKLSDRNILQIIIMSPRNFIFPFEKPFSVAYLQKWPDTYHEFKLMKGEL